MLLTRNYHHDEDIVWNALIFSSYLTFVSNCIILLTLSFETNNYFSLKTLCCINSVIVLLGSL